MTARQFPPCDRCAAGDHEHCTEGLCGCLIIHPQDDAIMRGFKRLKNPALEAP